MRCVAFVSILSAMEVKFVGGGREGAVVFLKVSHGINIVTLVCTISKGALIQSLVFVLVSKFLS